MSTKLSNEPELPSTREVLASTAFLVSPSNSVHRIVRLNDRLVAKYGQHVTVVEAETMQYVAEHSDVPVPKVHAAWTDKDTRQTCIIIDFVPGQTLESLLPSLTQEEKDEMGRLIKDALVKLRALPEPGYLGSVGKKPCSHGMFWALEGGPTPELSGPFENEAAFNEGLLRKLATMPAVDPPFLDFLRGLFSEAYQGHRTVLTHGRLHNGVWWWCMELPQNR